MAGRLLKVSSVATALVATSGAFLYTKQLDPNDLSLVRFGRAAAATAVISYDYLTAFRGVEPGTEEYSALTSKSHPVALSLIPFLYFSSRSSESHPVPLSLIPFLCLSSRCSESHPVPLSVIPFL
ncbi:unnamed protein product [Arctogadus glacialis]